MNCGQNLACDPFSTACELSWVWHILKETKQYKEKYATETICGPHRLNIVIPWPFKEKFAHRCLKPLHFQKVCYAGTDSWDTWTITGVSNGQTLDVGYHEIPTEKPQLNGYLQVAIHSLINYYRAIF